MANETKVEGGDLRVKEIFNTLKEHSLLLRMEGLEPRKERLRKLRKWVHTNRQRLHAAMYADFRKNPIEVDAIEVFHVLSEIKHALNNLDSWASRKKVDAPLTLLGTRSFIQYEPRGVCLIISPWNYPFSLCIGPFVSALAAGNAVILKPSELTPHVSSLIRMMVEEIFDPSVVFVFEGNEAISKELLRLPFDHIFFTGSPGIGKIVMKAAAENLASVTLELGGKSPVIVAESARIKEAAQRIAFTKFVNNGQTCVAPDYILIDKRIQERFIKELNVQIINLFADNNRSMESSPHYCRIVNEKHFRRLNELLQDSLVRGAKLELGGKVSLADRFMHPTVLSQVPLDANLMEEEIFGPILPIIVFAELDQAIKIVNKKPKPLGLYLFTSKRSDEEKVLKETTAGGVCINDCGIQFMHHNLPFGGVNNSGMGKSHGFFGFLAFSNEKAVLKQRHGFSTTKVFHPPYTEMSKKIMNWFLRLF